MLFLVAFIGVLGYFCATKALQLADLMVVSVLRSLEIVIGFGLQVTLLGSTPGKLELAGAALVITGISMISVETMILQRFPDSVRWLL